MTLLRFIQRSFAARLTMWVTGFLVAITVVVVFLLAGYTEDVLVSESIETTQQTLKNTAMRIDNSLRQADVAAKLEHQTFTADKALIENLIEVNNTLATFQQSLPNARFFVTTYQEYGHPSGFQYSKDETLQLDNRLLEISQDSYVFYQPVYNKRFNLVIVCPAMDIYDHYHDTQVTILLIGFFGLLLLLCICAVVIHRYLFSLHQLADAAQRIARGNLRETIPNTKRKDEIGRLQTSLSKMQRSLSHFMEEMRQQQEKLSKQNAELQKAYSEAQEYEDFKAVFIQKMTDQMVKPVDTISKSTNTICVNYDHLSKEEMEKLEADITTATETVTQLLDQLLNVPSKKSPFSLQQNPQDTAAL